MDSVPADPVRAADDIAARRYTVTGHINEGNDIFATDVDCPRCGRAT